METFTWKAFILTNILGKLYYESYTRKIKMDNYTWKVYQENKNWEKKTWITYQDNNNCKNNMDVLGKIPKTITGKKNKDNYT